MRRPKQIGLFYYSKRFVGSLDLFFDRHTLNFIRFHLDAGMVQLIWLEDIVEYKDGPVVDKMYYDCYGIIFDFQFWFFHIKIVFTPFCFKQKQPT